MSTKLHEEYMPLGSTKVDISLGLEDFDEDQRLGGRKVLDLIDTQVRSKPERCLGMRT